MRPDVPNGYADIVKTFGDIRSYIRADGTLRPEWERHELGLAKLARPLPLGWDLDVRVSQIRCHVKLVPLFEAVFEAIDMQGLWDGLRTYDGCFAYRAKRTSSKLSAHAWGIAIDLNAATNQQGKNGDMSPSLVQMFESQGFAWGGRWPAPYTDPMHFQFCTGY